MAGMLESLENQLNEVLVKKAPVQLPENARKWIATYAWVFALIGLIFGVLGFFPLLAAIGFVSVWGAAVGAGGYVIMAWISLIVMAGYLVVLAIATPKLKRMEKTGWNLLFYSAAFFFVYDVFNWLRYPSFSSVFGLVWNVLWAVVGFYFIFQIRSYFKDKTAASKK
jgi:hypothetical protein